MNIIDGATSYALVNKLRKFCYDSPDSPLMIYGADILKKGTPTSPQIAIAKVVLPVPVGPSKSTPLDGCTPR